MQLGTQLNSLELVRYHKLYLAVLPTEWSLAAVQGIGQHLNENRPVRAGGDNPTMRVTPAEFSIPSKLRHTHSCITYRVPRPSIFFLVLSP